MGRDRTHQILYLSSTLRIARAAFDTLPFCRGMMHGT